VEGRSQNLIGEAISASQGVVGQDEILIRPMLRTGEILESVPGMVVTQHSGTGKANQYFLRGFNLDHGTDFATYIDGMPINMRTHGHGQGYTDLNFIIPETVQTLKYQKGAYYADVGDFSGAGSAEFKTLTKSQSTQISASVGEFNYQRFVLSSGLAIGDPASQEQRLNLALEIEKYDGPWTDINEDVNKYNVFAKYSRKLADGRLNVSVMGYDNQWNSADQIPSRAVESELIDEFGSLDTSLGGQSDRFSINAQWRNENVSAAAYAIDYGLNLWSNFTYFLDNPTTGDQFEQVDQRQIYGGHLSYTDYTKWADYQVSNTFGAQFRYDHIDEVGLYRTAQRQRLGAIRSDTVQEGSLGVFWENKFIWTEQLRTSLGVRYDYYDFTVDSLITNNVNNIDLSTNKGKQNDTNLALKGSIIYTFNETLEGYVSAGQGFHSNDARGTIEQIDPNSGESIEPVDPLVDSTGYEVGLRINIDDSVNMSAALWSLDLDSELLFVGDAGNTEATSGSERQGVEFTGYYRFNEQWTLDVEYAYSNANFTGVPKIESAIPGAIEHVLQAGITFQQKQGWFGTARLRYFGERPLLEDKSIAADSAQLVNLNLGYVFSSGLKIRLDILNVLDSNDHDIDYFYASRLANEPAGDGVDDLHFHVLQPRSMKLTLVYNF
jgi:outer membrane receptor protein involved in Fe transport